MNSGTEPALKSEDRVFLSKLILSFLGICPALILQLARVSVCCRIQAKTNTTVGMMNGQKGTLSRCLGLTDESTGTRCNLPSTHAPTGEDLGFHTLPGLKQQMGALLLRTTAMQVGW